MPIPALALAALPWLARLAGGAAGFVTGGGTDLVSRQFNQDPDDNPSIAEYAMPTLAGLLGGAAGGGLMGALGVGSTAGMISNVGEHALFPKGNAGAVKTPLPTGTKPTVSVTNAPAVKAPASTGTAPDIKGPIPTRPATLNPITGTPSQLSPADLTASAAAKTNPTIAPYQLAPSMGPGSVGSTPADLWPTSYQPGLVRTQSAMAPQASAQPAPTTPPYFPEEQAALIQQWLNAMQRLPAAPAQAQNAIRLQ